MTVRVQHTEVRLFADRLKDVAPTARRELRGKIREAGAELTRAVRGAASWSSRIPGAVEMQVGFGVRIRVNRAKAPHARVLEFPNRGTMVRHPVFGNRDNWVETPGRPFFFTTVKAKEQAVVGKISDAIDEAIKSL